MSGASAPLYLNGESKLISNTFHRETTLDGKPLYLIEARNEEFEGTRYKVRFFKGKGKTTNRWKAKQFDEVFGYIVTLHADVEPWEKPSKKQSFEVEIEEEEDLFLSDGELDGDEEDDHEFEA